MFSGLDDTYIGLAATVSLILIGPIGSDSSAVVRAFALLFPTIVLLSAAATIIGAGVQITLWCTEALHGISPALVALLGALLITAPKLGSTKLGDALRAVPWSLLMFMASTVVLGTALSTSGAARWLGAGMFDGWTPCHLWTAARDRRGRWSTRPAAGWSRCG